MLIERNINQFCINNLQKMKEETKVHKSKLLKVISSNIDNIIQKGSNSVKDKVLKLILMN